MADTKPPFTFDPCPFCGCTSIKIHWFYPRAQCRECRAIGPRNPGLSEIGHLWRVKLWNRRGGAPLDG